MSQEEGHHIRVFWRPNRICFSIAFRLSTHTFLRWPQELHSWVNRSSSARTLHLTSCLKDLLAKYKTKTLFNLPADRNTHANKNNPDVIIAIDPWIHTGSMEQGPAQRGRVRGVHCGWYLYPPFTLQDSKLPTQSCSNWMRLSVPARPSAKRRTPDALWCVDLLFVSCTASLSSPASVAQLNPNTSPAAPQPFLAYRMTVGLKASCQTWYETWLLPRDVSMSFIPCCTEGPLSSFFPPLNFFFHCRSAAIHHLKFCLLRSPF